MRGFSIIELLVAMSLTVIVCGAALSFIGPANDAFQVQPELADLQQRMRVGIEAVQQDVRMAGAGLYSAGDVGPLLHAFAPIMPYRAFEGSDAATGTFFRADTISVTYVPSTPAQTRLSALVAPGSSELALEQLANCPPATGARVCGFQAGDHVLVFDRLGDWGVLEIDAVDTSTGRLRTRGDSARGFAAGANVAKVRATTYSLKADPQTAAFQLVRTYAFGIAQPVVDHVVKLEFQYFGNPQPPLVSDEGTAEHPDVHTSYGPAPPPIPESRGVWPPGENCIFAVANGEHEPRLGALGPPGALVQMTPAQLTDGPWCPDEGARYRYDADLLRVRRVRFILRVQTALASLRGPAGTLFTNGGTARAGSRFVPDMEMQIDVSPRNLNLEP